MWSVHLRDLLFIAHILLRDYPQYLCQVWGHVPKSLPFVGWKSGFPGPFCSASQSLHVVGCNMWMHCIHLSSVIFFYICTIYSWSFIIKALKLSFGAFVLIHLCYKLLFFSSLFLLLILKTQKWQDVRTCLRHVTDKYQTGFVPPFLQNSGFIPISSKLSLSSVRNMQNHLENRPIFKLNETGNCWVYCKNMEQRCQSHSKNWHKATRNVL